MTTGSGGSSRVPSFRCHMRSYDKEQSEGAVSSAFCSDIKIAKKSKNISVCRERNMITGFKSLWTLGLVFVCHVLVINAADSVPVLLWGGDGETSSPEPVNPLHKNSRVDFEKILNRKLGKSQPPLLVFVRDSFCNEDLTQNAEVSIHFDFSQLVTMGANIW